MFNRATLIGHVGSEPEVRELRNGTLVAKVSLATSEKFKDRDGERQEKTQWHRLTFFGAKAEVIEEYLSTGDKLHVEGRIEYSESEGRDGETKYWTDIVVSDFTFLGGGDGDRGGRRRSGGRDRDRGGRRGGGGRSRGRRGGRGRDRRDRDDERDDDRRGRRSSRRRGSRGRSSQEPDDDLPF